MRDIFMLSLGGIQVRLYLLGGLGKRRSALIAVFAAQFVLKVAFRAGVFDFTGGHGDEKPGIAVDHLDVPYDEGVVECYRGIGFKLFVRRVLKHDPYFGNLHTYLLAQR